VAQRARLADKASPPPHVLMMTATPIPRTLSLVAYGDMTCSIIDELPPGRTPIRTSVLQDDPVKRQQVRGFDAFQRCKGAAAAGLQVRAA
jgi:ATP-dependent DNA helicase RecG